MSHKLRLRANRAKIGGVAVVAGEPSRYATEEEAFKLGTRQLKQGFYRGRGDDLGRIMRATNSH